MKINYNLVGEGGGLFMVYLGCKKNCSFFFTLNVNDKMLNEDNWLLIYSAS